MVLSYSTIRVIRAILEKRFENKPQLSHNDILVLFDEFWNSPENYIGTSKNINNLALEKSEARRVFEGFVEYLLYRNIANYDSMVLITAQKGMGKSSFAIMLAYVWCKFLGIKFDSDRHIAYTNQQVQDKIDKLSPFEPLILDEAVNFITSEEWNKLENRELKKKLAQVRTKHLLYILCFPLKIQKVDKQYLDSLCNYWIDLFKRGGGALFVRDANPYYDAWRMNEFKNVGSYTEFTPTTKIVSMLAKHPNFWYVIRAPKPSPRLYSKYLKVREFNVYDDANVLNTVNKSEVVRALLLLILKELLTRDSSLSIKRLLMHLENEYKIKIEKSTFENIMEDARMLALKVKENNLGRFIK